MLVVSGVITSKRSTKRKLSKLSLGPTIEAKENDLASMLLGLLVREIMVRHSVRHYFNSRFDSCELHMSSLEGVYAT